MKSIELVIYLTIHVALEIELDTAVGTGVGCCPVVGPEAGRVAAEGQEGGTAASQLLPMHLTLVPLQGLPSQNPFTRSSFSNRKNFAFFSWNFAAVFFCFQLFFQAAAAATVVFPNCFCFLSIFSVRCLLLPACTVFCVACFSSPVFFDVLYSVLPTSRLFPVAVNERCMLAATKPLSCTTSSRGLSSSLQTSW